MLEILRELFLTANFLKSRPSCNNKDTTTCNGPAVLNSQPRSATSREPKPIIRLSVSLLEGGRAPDRTSQKIIKNWETGWEKWKNIEL